MVNFGTGYFNAMDREYFANEPEPEGHGHSCHDHHHTQDVGVQAGELGMSFMVGIGSSSNVAGIASKIRAGAKNIELGFKGTPGGKSSAGNMSPEYFGKLPRQALREAAKINRVDFTLHTNVGVAGLSGQTQRGFDKQSKERSLEEIKRAIDFAEDVSRGGAIVVHTGEKGRAISSADWNDAPDMPKFLKGYRKKFQGFPDEARTAATEIVDQRTGQIIYALNPDKPLFRPKYKRYQEGTEEWKKYGGKRYYDEENKVWVEPNDYIDYFGNKVSKRADRVVEFDSNTNDFKTELYEMKNAEKDAEEMKRSAQAFFKKYGPYEKNKDKWEKYAEPFMLMDNVKNARSLDEIHVDKTQVLVIEQLENQAATSRGFATQYLNDFEDMRDKIFELKKLKDFYAKLDKSLPEDEKYKLMRSTSGELIRGLPETAQKEQKSILSIIDEQIDASQKRLKTIQQQTASSAASAQDSINTIKYLKNAEHYALDEAFDSYARAGIHAMRRSDALRDKGELKKNIFVAMENLFPEAYGSHPVELVRLVKQSREKMTELLQTEYGKKEKEAAQLANEHIKATLDLGHLNIWRKHWIQDKSKSLKENDKDFDKWVLDMVEYMSKEDIIGHVHVDDNLGYGDEHLAPGDGNAPIKDMIKILKKNGYKGELIVEPGADWDLDKGAFSSLSKAWKYLGSPIGGTVGGFAARGSQSWSGMQYGHFGQNAPAYFTFGSYSPSEDFKLWSGVPLD